RISDWPTFERSFITQLQEIYLLRLADRELSWNIEWLTVDRCLTTQGDRVILDVTEYVTRLLAKNSRLRTRDLFETSVHAWRPKLCQDPRVQIRGHDFVCMLAWVIGHFRGVKAFA